MRKSKIGGTPGELGNTRVNQPENSDKYHFKQFQEISRNCLKIALP